MSDKNYYGKQLRAERRTAGKTMGQVARQLGLKSVSFIADVEHGRRNPLSTEQTISVCELFGIDPGPLLLLAAEKRRSVKLTPASDRIDVAVGLARQLDNLTPDELAQIREILRGAQEGD